MLLRRICLLGVVWALASSFITTPASLIPAHGVRLWAKNDAGEKIIKNGELRLLVADTSQALHQVDELMLRYRGEVVSFTEWSLTPYGASYQAAELTVKVPVGDFERVFLSLRRLGMQVKDESTTGENVSSTYADLRSRYNYLIGQRERLIGLSAKSESETARLRMQEELTTLDDQLRNMESQIADLDDQVENSRITLQLDPFIPTPTPTLTPTPLPTSTPTSWSPQNTARKAVAARQEIIDWGITFGPYSCIPLCLCGGPPLIILLILRLRKRKRNTRSTSS